MNVFERLRKFDQHSESDLKLMILNLEDIKRMRHQEGYWKRRSHDLSALAEQTEKQVEVARQKICFRPARHMWNHGGYSLATRRNYGHPAAATASIMVTIHLGDSGFLRDPPSVSRFDHSAATAKILRSRVFSWLSKGSSKSTNSEGDSTHQQDVGTPKLHTSVVTSSFATFSAEDLNLGGCVVNVDKLQSIASAIKTVGDLQPVVGGLGWNSLVLLVLESVGCPIWLTRRREPRSFSGLLALLRRCAEFTKIWEWWRCTALNGSVKLALECRKSNESQTMGIKVLATDLQTEGESPRKIGCIRGRGHRGR